MKKIKCLLIIAITAICLNSCSSCSEEKEREKIQQIDNLLFFGNISEAKHVASTLEDENKRKEYEQYFIKRAAENAIYNLISKATADGEVTEKERQTILKIAAEKGLNPDEIDIEIDAKLSEKSKQEAASSSIDRLIAELDWIENDRKEKPDDGMLKKAAKSLLKTGGDIIESTTGKEVFDKTEEGYSDEYINEKKKATISTFPIPKTKKEILEFLAYSVPLSNPDNSGKFFAPIWKAKSEQVILNARTYLKNDKEALAEVESYSKEMKRKK